MGLELFEEKPTDEQFECIRELHGGLVNIWNIEFTENSETLSEEIKQDIQRITDKIGVECLVKYMQDYEKADKLRKYIVRYFM